MTYQRGQLNRRVQSLEDPDLILPIEENPSNTRVNFNYRKVGSNDAYSSLCTDQYPLQQTNYSRGAQMPPPRPGFLSSKASPEQNPYPSSQSYQRPQQYPVTPPPPPPTQTLSALPLLDSKKARIQKQLSKRKLWKPWFIRTVSLAQLVLVIYSLYRNSQLTGSWIQIHPYFNWLIGPAPETLINIGARFVPCMRSTDIPIMCNNMDSCSLEQLCGFGGFKGGTPDQWFRFIVPIFLHGGVLHYLLNMSVQLTTGAHMEREIGPFRMALLYMVSGIGGFIFGGNFAPQNLPSVGASGALFGLIGCQLVNLIQHWRLFANPCCELIKMVIMLLINFAIGLLPSIDNFAHIGGFVCGVFAAFVLLPTVHTSSFDKWFKHFLKVLGLAIVIILYWLGLKYFYSGENPNKYCPWCKYFSCLPFDDWCNGIY